MVYYYIVSLSALLSQSTVIFWFLQFKGNFVCGQNNSVTGSGIENCHGCCIKSNVFKLTACRLFLVCLSLTLCALLLFGVFYHG